MIHCFINESGWRRIFRHFNFVSRISDRVEVISFVKDKILQRLLEVTRKKAGKNPNPTYAIIDSQSVDTTYKSEQVGFDGGKKRHKRHILTDFACENIF